MSNNQVKIGIGAIVLWEGKVLLIQRNKPPKSGEWSIPGGHMLYGETMEETAIREAREECGIDIDVLGLVDAIDLETDDGRQFVLIDFCAKPKTFDLKAGDDAEKAVWADVKDLKRFNLWHKTEEVIMKAVRQYG